MRRITEEQKQELVEEFNDIYTEFIRRTELLMYNHHMNSVEARKHLIKMIEGLSGYAEYDAIEHMMFSDEEVQRREEAEKLLEGDIIHNDNRPVLGPVCDDTLCRHNSPGFILLRGHLYGVYCTEPNIQNEEAAREILLDEAKAGESCEE